MMTINKLLVFAALFAYIYVGCSKDVNPELPEATQQGKNTFECKVNGRIWLPRGSLGNDIPAGVDLSYDPAFNGGTMSLKAKYWYRDSQNQNIATVEHIDISLGKLSKPGTYSFNSKDSMALGVYSTRVQNETFPTTTIRSCDYDGHDDTTTGILTITSLDVKKGVLAGKFEFIITKSKAAADCDPIVRLTEGRFDMKL